MTSKPATLANAAGHTKDSSTHYITGNHREWVLSSRYRVASTRTVDRDIYYILLCR